VEILTAGTARAALPGLIGVLEDAVAGGASIGFLPPLAPGEARAYWKSVVDAVERGATALLVARRDGDVLGTVQLHLEDRANGRHRAELAKLMVHRAHRRQGIGARLMAAAERDARARGLTTLLLDTRLGDESERLYRACGWTFVGSIPRYARSANGVLDANAIYYRLLE
jgi:ribosomal protein S18 acetylase RimI-like enzyme